LQDVAYYVHSSITKYSISFSLTEALTKNYKI
jgi:hypothetical protein